jgi:hypothetical protein
MVFWTASATPARTKGVPAMAITSINHNPMNDSKYARRRSLWKGRHNQLREAIAQLHGMNDIVVHEYSGPMAEAMNRFYDDWGLGAVNLKRRAPVRGEILGQWVYPPVPTKMKLRIRGLLEADFALLWNDFYGILGRRVGASGGIGANDDERGTYHGETVVVFAYGPSSFDLIVSKYGYGDSLKKNHHFFHWQASTKYFRGMVNVDDYEDEENGLTFYVVN